MDHDKIAKDVLNIDPNALDSEWIRQPNLYFQWSAKLAEAQSDRDQAKGEIDLVYSELDRKIRENPDTFGITKVTEHAIKACIPGRKRYKQALAKYNELRDRANVYQALVNALDHKKKALESLVHLHGQNYFSAPRPPKGTHEMVDEMEKQAIRRRGKKRRDVE